MDFNALKKQSKNDFDSLLKQVEKLNTYSSEEKDSSLDNYWKPTPDKSGNALAVIRFLRGAAVDGNDAVPFVRYWDHGFQGPTGKWYIEKSLTTFGEKDPVSDYNSSLWGDRNDPSETPERKQARNQKRRLHYVSNILVISDPQNKENEGKVFLFKYGKKIMDKITKMMNPDLESEAKVNPFDLWEGAPFKLKVTKQNANINGKMVSFPNYDESVFLTPGPVAADDAEIERIWKSGHSLTEIVDRKNYKTYEELKRRLDDVLGLSSGASSAPKSFAETIDEDIPFTNSKPVASKAPVVEEEEDDDLAMFRKLAEE